MGPNKHWEDIVRRKRQEREDRLPQDWKLDRPDEGSVYNPLQTLVSSGALSPEELDWTDSKKHDATDLLQRISSGEISAEQLITAFCKRAVAAQSLTNFMTEVNITQAIERAKELDRHFRETGRVAGPLHGLPLTVKDTIDIKGFDSSAGITGWCFDPAKENAPLVQILVDAGAVVIGKTNVPQTVLAADSVSVVWGRTVNAHNSTFGAGGSTGGEGSGLAMGASLVGLGSDGAGSCRMPAAANGIVGYRPSGYRLPGGKRAIFTPGRAGITQTGPVAGLGLLGLSVRDLRAVSKVVSDSQPWEKSTMLYPSPWLGISAPQRLRIGVWAVDTPNSYLHLFPPVRRGFLATQDRLRTAGFDLVEFIPPDMSQVWGLCKEFLMFQGIDTLVEKISEEPITKIVAKTGIFVPESPRLPLGPEKLHQLNTRLLELATAMDQSWNRGGQPLDVLLSVTAPNTAVPFDQWRDTTYTCIFNCVDWPAISLPLEMKCDKSIDCKHDNFKSFSEEDARLEGLYGPVQFDGLPLSIQLAGRKFQDEKLLAIADLLHPIIKGEEVDFKKLGNSTG